MPRPLVVLVDYDDTLVVINPSNPQQAVINQALIDSMVACGLTDDNVINVIFTIYDATQAVMKNVMIQADPASGIRRIEGIGKVKTYTQTRTGLKVHLPGRSAPIGIDFANRVVTSHDYRYNQGYKDPLGFYFHHHISPIEATNITDYKYHTVAEEESSAKPCFIEKEARVRQYLFARQVHPAVKRIGVNIAGDSNCGKAVMFEYVCKFYKNKGVEPVFLFFDDKQDHLSAVTAMATFGLGAYEIPLETIHLPVIRGGVCELNQTQITAKIKECLVRLRPMCSNPRW